MVLQNYQNLIEMTSNMINIVAFGVGLKCPLKIHLNTHSVGGGETNYAQYILVPTNNLDIPAHMEAAPHIAFGEQPRPDKVGVPLPLLSNMKKAEKGCCVKEKQ